MVSRTLFGASALLIGLLLAAAAVAALNPSYSDKVPVDTVPFYDVSVYDPAVPQPNDYLENPVGNWPAHHGEMMRYMQQLAAVSDRVLLEPHGFTHEGKQLFHLVISSPQNLARLDEFIATMDKVADPRRTSSAQLEDYIAGLPAFAWMAYTIHGDEISGTDAAIQLAYHLAAANDSATQHLRDNLIMLIDPLENPDGRDRYISMLRTYRSKTENYDQNAMQHQGTWPWGRSNHYWFDLNRDWILLTQPETRGRAEAIVKYHPVVVIDGHEMGSNETFLFSPPRQPINYNTPDNVIKWYDVFRDEQAAAFDQRGWPYYTGEWNEQWYIGYASAWPTMFGAVGILYEQAGVDGSFVKQRNGYLLTYHEAINHHFTSTLANLRTTANNRLELLRDYYDTRRKIIDEGRRSNLSFVFPPDKDVSKLNRLIGSLVGQGIEVQQAAEPFTLPSARDIYGEVHSNERMPAGTYFVSTAQPHGALAKAVLEFDLHLNEEFLKEERRELEKFGETRMYETSAWSVPMAYDVAAYEANTAISVPARTVTDLTAPVGRLSYPAAQFGFIADMEGGATYRLLSRLFDEELTVHASEKPFTVEGRDFQAGALLIRRRGNPENMSEILERLATEEGINIYGVNTGLSTQGSHLGAPTFRVLRQPRIALVAGAPMDYTASGSLWFTVDAELGISHSLISVDQLTRGEISQYNVLVLPSAWGNSLGQRLGKAGKAKIAEWVEDGGTLVTMGSSAVWAADTATGLSHVRIKRQVLDKLDQYDTWLAREMTATNPRVDTMAVWHPDKVPAGEGGEEESSKRPGLKAAEELDQWQRRFFPRGVILRSIVDTEDWLAFGMDEQMPIGLYTTYAFMAAEPVRTVARLSPEPDNLRMSGLLWPEARQRWAGTAAITRERRGNGQIVMFASQPYFRAYWRGTWQPFMNAILYGPGFTRSLSPYQQQR